MKTPKNVNKTLSITARFIPNLKYALKIAFRVPKRCGVDLFAKRAYN